MIDPQAYLIETFGWSPDKGALNLEAHLSRMAASAALLGFTFDPAAALREVGLIAGEVALRCRLTLTREGVLTLTQAPLGPNAQQWSVALHEVPLQADALWLRHKTSDRGLYDQARATLPYGVDEWLFVNEAGALCEGTITNLFVEKDGLLMTPHLSCGLLPGTLRARLLAQGRAREALLYPDDLQEHAFFMGNDLRGLIPARLIA